MRMAATILDDLEAGSSAIEGTVYGTMEKSLLLEFLRRAQKAEPTDEARKYFGGKVEAALNSANALTSMRKLAIARPEIPLPLRKKAAERLELDAERAERTAKPQKTKGWRSLPQARELWHSESMDERQKEEAAKILDAIFEHLARYSRKSMERSWVTVSNALAKRWPILSLRDLAISIQVKLPQEFNQTNHAVVGELSTSARAEVAAALGLFSLDRVQATCQTPSEAEYQNPPKLLNDPKSAYQNIMGSCAKAKLSLESESEFERHDVDDKAVKRGVFESRWVAHYFRCTLKVSIESIGVETGYGEAFTKAEARSAAWLHVLSKLHSSGALAQILPLRKQRQQAKAEQLTEVYSLEQGPKETAEEETTEEETAEAKTTGEEIAQEATEKGATEELASEELASEQNPMNEDEMIEDEIERPTEVDAQTLEEEKDAKIEIYNYSAGLGVVPQFTAKAVQPWIPRAKRSLMTGKLKPFYQVTIKADELSINASATSKQLKTAEIAASLAFKQQAQAQEEDRKPQRKFRALNTDTAKEFLNFCRSRDVELTLELETQSVVAADGSNNNQASLTTDSKTLGQAVETRLKKDAHAVAYLTGALEIAMKHPQLYVEFEVELKKGNGKILKPAKTIDLDLAPEVSQSMREALVEAHAAGLPTSHEVLIAESNEDEDSISRRRPPLSKNAIMRARHRLAADHDAFCKDPATQELRDKKEALPMRRHASELLKMVRKSAYSVVIGSTGSGKTTQVPQILFEDAIRQLEGPHCNIVCTQPRRIAATSVAQRVAEERNESLRKTVGYQVRFDAQQPYNPYGITYCTTGTLLEKLKNDPDGVLESTSHILIDEVHERDMYIDFLMIVLKKSIQSRVAEGKKVPKVVLMSATLDSELFANYFKQPDEEGKLQPAPCLSVPGRTFPVKEKYLGTILSEMFQAHGPGTRQLLEEDRDSKEFLGIEADFSARMSGQDTSKPESAIDWKRERSLITDDEGESSAKDEREEAFVPVGLVAATLAHICATSSDEHAILVFLPGLHEITHTEKTLLQGSTFGVDFSDSSKFKICLLHSTLPKEQQNEVFVKTPSGCRKIILSTNIAETSVTVTDVKYVVDAGKLRESRYDQLRRITKLQCVWESKSNSKQRMGRAGRVQEGFYYALFSKERADSLKAVGLPQLLRSDLQETCLSIKAQRFNEPVASFLAQAIEPPSERAVDLAIQNLIATEALTADQELTALGRVLSSLPVHPALGKTIILGIVFKCLDPMIILGAAAEERSLFHTPLADRVQAAQIHRAYARETESDHLAHLEAYRELRGIRDGLSAVNRRARQQYLHFGAYRTVNSTAHQIVQILIDCGLIPDERASKDANSTAYGPAALNTNSDNDDLIKCLLLAGSHPKLAVKQTARARSFRTPSEGTVLIHPTSVLRERRSAQEKAADDPLVHPPNTLLAFSTLSRSTDGSSLFLRSASKVTPLMVLLFGGALRLSESGKRLNMDGWLPFKIEGEGGEGQREFETKLVLEFRKGLERVLKRACASLERVKRVGGGEGDGEEEDVEGEGKVAFVDDPVREQFARRVVEVLRGGKENEMKKMMEAWNSSSGVMRRVFWALTGCRWKLHEDSVREHLHFNFLA